MSWCPQMHINFTSPLLGSKPSCLTSNPFYRLICQLKFFYYLKTQLKRVGGGGRGGQRSRTDYL